MFKLHANTRLPAFLTMAAVLLALPAIPAEAPSKDPFSKSEKTSKARETAARQRPLIYNSDGAHIFQGEKIRGDGFQYNRATDFRDRPLSLAELLEHVDEVANSQVTTYVLNGNAYETVLYHSAHERRMGRGVPMEQIRTEPARYRISQYNTILALNAFEAAGIDPFRALVDRIRERGMEPIAAVRIQGIHVGGGAATRSAWLQAHPECLLRSPRGSGGGNESAALNFALPAVRDRKAALIREFLAAYDWDGIEIDFQRFPLFFEAGTERVNTPLMTEFMIQLRAVVDEVGKTKGRRLSLAVRVPETPERCAELGLDPIAWANTGLIDFLTLGRFLNQNNNPGSSPPEIEIDLHAFRSAIERPIPIYGTLNVVYRIQIKEAGDNTRAHSRLLTPADFRREATKLWDQGLYGVQLYNFFMHRAHRREPPFFLLQELGDRSTIRPKPSTEERAWLARFPLEEVPVEFREKTGTR